MTDLPTERLLIVVISTTGQGDAPDSAQRFLRFFRKQKSATWLNNTHYAVLALGDTNYDKFCEPGKRMERVSTDACVPATYVRCCDAVLGWVTRISCHLRVLFV